MYNKGVKSPKHKSGDEVLLRKEDPTEPAAAIAFRLAFLQRQCSGHRDGTVPCAFGYRGTSGRRHRRHRGPGCCPITGDRCIGQLATHHPLSRILRATAHSAPARALQHVIGEAAIPPQLEPSITNSNAQVDSAAAPQHIIGEVAIPPRLESASSSATRRLL
uniref:Uncharacterized protein n=1 Tax=Anopheles gambiae TaxID=7165 RepID=A0A0E4G9Q9_ANOGA